MGNGGNGGRKGPSVMIGEINLNELPDLACECKSIYFTEMRRFKKIPSVVSKSGRDEVAQLQVFVCVNCKKEANLNL